MALAAAAGHRVVLVTATSGECGEVADGVLAPGEMLGERRQKELAEAAAILGVARVEFLGYRDSGMIGTPENEDPQCFWQTPVDEAATRLARILAEERPAACAAGFGTESYRRRGVPPGSREREILPDHG